LFFVVLLAVLFVKFHILNITMSSRHVLTPVTFFGSAGVLVCLLTPAMLLPGRWRGRALLAANAALSLLVLADLLYLRYYSDLFSLRNLALTGQAREIADSILALTRYSDVLFFADIPLFALAHRGLSRNDAWMKPSWTRRAAICAIFLAGAGGIVWKVDNYNRAVRGALRALWDRPSVAVSTGTLVYHFADAWNILDEAISKEAFAAEDEDKITAWLAERLTGNLPEEADAAARGKNLILIQVESLQAFTVGLRVGGTELTPNINRLAGESLRFPNAFNQTAGGNSSDAEFMVNTSLYPTAKGVAFVRFAGNSYHSLGTQLRAMGYQTAAFHGDRPGFWNRNHMYPSLGFEHYISKNEFNRDESIGLGLSDRSFFEQSLGYLAKFRDDGKPFFAFLVTLTSHYPFNFGALKEQVTDLGLGELEGTVLGDYLRSVRYTDAQIGAFIDGLEREGMLEDSVVVLYGDHPAIPRGDSKALGDLLGRDLSSAAAWRTIQKIPLMIRLPHGAMARTIDTPTGQMDVAPTLAALMGFRMPAAFGKNLLKPTQGETGDYVVFRNGSFIRGDTWVQPQSAQAFDLRSFQAINYEDISASDAEEVNKRLRYNDRILENNLVKRLSRSGMLASNQVTVQKEIVK